MNVQEVQKAVEDMGQAFHAFKEKNDERLKELEKRGSSDAVLNEHVDRINKEVSELNAKVEDAIKAANRPGFAGEDKAEMDLRNQAAEFYSSVNKKIVKPEEVDIEEYKNYTQNFDAYLRRGDKNTAIQNAMSVGSDPEGGYFVPATMSSRIIKRIFETSEMRAVASVISIGTDALEYPLDLQDGISGGWVGETDTRGDTGNPKVGEGRIPVFEQFAQPKVTQKLLDDAVVDIEGWLINKTTDKMVRTENTAFVSGDGVNKPRGFLDYKSAAVTTKDATRAWGKLQYKATGSAGDFGTSGSPARDNVDGLIDLIYAMKPQYRSGAVWAANRATIAEARKLKDVDGNYLWTMGNIQTGQPSTLLGYGITELEDMPDIASGEFAMAFANFREGYQIVDRQGIRLLRDPYTSKPFVKFYITKRVGGDVVNFDAIKLLKFASS